MAEVMELDRILDHTNITTKVYVQFLTDVVGDQGTCKVTPIIPKQHSSEDEFDQNYTNASQVK